MADIYVPELGESVADATVGKWLKQEGETVKSGEALVELETDKINFEVEALKYNRSILHMLSDYLSRNFH